MSEPQFFQTRMDHARAGAAVGTAERAAGELGSGTRNTEETANSMSALPLPSVSDSIEELDPSQDDRLPGNNIPLEDLPHLVVFGYEDIGDASIIRMPKVRLIVVVRPRSLSSFVGGPESQRHVVLRPRRSRRQLTIRNVRDCRQISYVVWHLEVPSDVRQVCPDVTLVFQFTEHLGPRLLQTDRLACLKVRQERGASGAEVISKLTLRPTNSVVCQRSPILGHPCCSHGVPSDIEPCVLFVDRSHWPLLLVRGDLLNDQLDVIGKPSAVRKPPREGGQILGDIMARRSELIEVAVRDQVMRALNGPQRSTLLPARKCVPRGSVEINQAGQITRMIAHAAATTGDHSCPTSAPQP